MQIRKLIARGRWAPAVTAVLILLPAFVGAQERSLPEGYGEARAELVAAMAAADMNVVESLIDPEGRIVFSMQKSQSDVSLAEWLGSFRGMVEGGTLVVINDEESRSGGTGTTAWSFSRQKLSWSKVDGGEPFATATWYTTEVWERRDSGWKLVHVHHSTAPASDEVGE